MIGSVVAELLYSDMWQTFAQCLSHNVSEYAPVLKIYFVQVGMKYEEQSYFSGPDVRVSFCPSLSSIIA